MTETLRNLDLTTLQIIKYGQILALWKNDTRQEIQYSKIRDNLKQFNESTLVRWLNELVELDVLEKIYKERSVFYRYTKKGKAKLTEMLFELANLLIKMEKPIHKLKIKRDEINSPKITAIYNRVSDETWRDTLDRFIVKYSEDPSKIVAYYTPVIINEDTFNVISFFPNQEFQETVKMILGQYRTKKERNIKLRQLMRPILEDIKPLFEKRLKEWKKEIV